MTPEENKEIVQAFCDQWNSGSIEFDRLVDPKVRNHQPDRDPEVGIDRFRQAIGGVMAAVPDSIWTTVRMIAEGEFVACHNTWTGTYGGDVFRGVSITHRERFSVEHVHVYRISDRRIAEHWVVRDDLGMMLQLGAIKGSSA